MSKNDRSERTHREILDAAWRLIVKRGIAVSMGEIAQAAGITRQSIYVHFRSRGGLLIALVRRADERERIWEKFAEAFDTKPAAARLDACLRVWFAFVPRIHPVARDFIRLRSKDDEAARAWNDRMSELRQFFKLLVRGLHEERALAPGWTVPRAADFLWAGCSVQAWELLVIDRGWSHASASKAIRKSLAQTLLASQS
jgi:AcrR family transcriptional regulator